VKIGELASATATKVETVRYYEKIGLLPPPARTSGNYRAYGSEHLARLSFIRRARDLGFTLEAVRELLTLSDDKAQSCEAVDGIARVHLKALGVPTRSIERRRLASPRRHAEKRLHPCTKRRQPDALRPGLWASGHPARRVARAPAGQLKNAAP
jgi:DNA-binding transcriptional MerR regulator